MQTATENEQYHKIFALNGPKENYIPPRQKLESSLSRGREMPVQK